MNPLSPEKILRNLDHGYFMTHEEQAEAAAYIRQLQQEIEALKEAAKIGKQKAQDIKDAAWCIAYDLYGG